MNNVSFNSDESPRHLAQSGGQDRPLSLEPYRAEPILGDEEGEGINLHWIWQVLVARWYWILAAGALGLLVSIAQSLMAVPMYRATTTIEINPPRVPVVGAAGFEDVLSYISTNQQFLATQYGLLESRDLAKRVVEDLGLAGGASTQQAKGELPDRIEGLADQLSGGLTITPVPDSRLVELSYVAPDPQEAARIVNGFANAYIQDSIDRRFEATSTSREFLAGQIESTRTQLAEAERQMVEYAKANNIIMPVNISEDEEAGGSASLTSTSLTSLNEALAAAQQKRIAAEQRFRQAGSLTENQSASASLRSEKAALEAEYREKSTYLGDDYPDMVRLRARISALEQAINSASGTASTGLGAEYRAALAEENELRAQVKQLSANMLQEQELSSEYKVLQREVETKSSLYQALLERYNQIGVVEGVGNPVGAVVDAARPPGAPYTPNIPRSLTLGLILGLGFGLVATFIYEFLTDRIKTADDVRDKLRQPLLGSIPLLKRGERLSDAIDDAISPISEAYSSMLTTLQFATHEGMPQVLAVTSVGPAEGKSTTSLVLAERLANIGRKVLLIDGDMRRPSFVFEEDQPTGLSQLLTGHGDLRSHILRTGTKNLCLIQSGPIPPNPSLLLSSRNLREIITQLRATFDNIIIDCPPKLGFADAALLGGLGDGTLLIVESGKTRRQLALEAISQLRAAGNQVLGVALTKVPRRAGNYGYSYHYYNDTKMLGEPARAHELSPEPFSGGEAHT